MRVSTDRDEVVRTAFDDQSTVPENGLLVVVAADGLLGNDRAPDGSALHVESIVPPQHGELQFLPDGSFVYTPKSGFNREDVFTYIASNGTFESQPATVRITIETEYPWHNGLNPCNVNDDDHVAPLDALLVINALNRGDGGLLPLDRARPLAAPFYDVNRDGSLSPIDALLVINVLNDNRGEGELTDPPTAATLWSFFADLNLGANGSNDDVADHTADTARTERPTPSKDTLQSLDFFFARLGSADDETTELATDPTTPTHIVDLEQFLERLLGAAFEP